MSAPAVVGLTGGIGSGKSTVSAMLVERGATIIDADQLARAIVEPGRPALDAIARSFGARILHPDGALDRARLGAKVFEDRDALRLLETITHPEILRLAQERIDTLGADGWGWVIYEAALIVERKLHPPLDLLVVVHALEPTRLRRVMRRDHMAADEVLARMAAQARPQTLLDAADIILENEGDEATLATRVDEVYGDLVARFGAPRREGTP